MGPQFLFATGIENSNPPIQNGKERGNELEKCGHDKFWQRDFELVQELGPWATDRIRLPTSGNELRGYL